MSRNLVLAASLTLATVPTDLLGHSSPFLSESEYDYLAGEISGDASYEHIRFHTQFHKPRGGTPGLMEVARYFEAKAREYGLEQVRLIRQKASYPGWESKGAELWLVEPEVERLASTLQTQLHLADYSRATETTAELVEVGAGTGEADYAGREVQGKLVLAYGSAAEVMREAVWKRGAAGLLLRPDPSSAQALHYSHQVRWTSVPRESEDAEKKPGTFAFVLSHAQGAALAERLRTANRPLKARARIDARFSEGWQVMVEAFIRGGEISDQDVVLTGHLQEEKFSANDDGSGSANTLEVARALAKLIGEGALPRPRRSLRFWWVTEIGSERQFFADHPQEAKKLLVNINQDMVGADQGQDILRTQNVTQVPFSRFHFLNDVAAATVEFVVRGNTAELAKGQAGTRQPYSRPILSRLGSRHRYNAKLIPFHNNTDHMTFNEAPIGVPGISLTNWPDNYIHTTDDDLWNIDRTQLQRNAFAVAAIAYCVARAGDGEGEAIAGEVFGRGSRRLAEAFDLATRMVRKEANRAAAFRLATNQVEQAVLRETQALRSVAVVAPGKKNLVETLGASLRKLGQSHQLELVAYYRAVTGEARPPAIQHTEREKALRAIVPSLAAGPAEFLEGRGKVKTVDKLHPLMAFEIANFIDGRRNGLEIYEAVVAEALAGGEDYYGTVSAEQVHEYLRNLAEAQLIRLGSPKSED
jgi:hypothetical protein